MDMHFACRRSLISFLFFKKEKKKVKRKRRYVGPVFFSWMETKNFAVRAVKVATFSWNFLSYSEVSLKIS
jgi:hypothetical protein